MSKILDSKDMKISIIFHYLLFQSSSSLRLSTAIVCDLALRVLPWLLLDVKRVPALVLEVEAVEFCLERVFESNLLGVD
jgi:hypothetical protein